MNWNRDDWMVGAHTLDDTNISPLFSNLYHTKGEVVLNGPGGVNCRNMVEAHKLTMNFYRTACRQLPAIIHKNGSHFLTDIHKSKLNLAKWIRKGSNMRDPSAVSASIRNAFDFLYLCSYGDFESGYYFRYLNSQPENNEGSHVDITAGTGINMIEFKKYKNKSTFLRKFIKGTRPLMI